MYTDTIRKMYNMWNNDLKCELCTKKWESKPMRRGRGFCFLS
uniref:Uncharacterized protein n=1 Tax=Lepeophtheirus salmonis TaxID=72036 RepID=A0A0K2U7U3_LEPSM